jgi:hypothetical protein
MGAEISTKVLPSKFAWTVNDVGGVLTAVHKLMKSKSMHLGKR